MMPVYLTSPKYCVIHHDFIFVFSFHDITIQKRRSMKNNKSTKNYGNRKLIRKRVIRIEERKE